MGKREGLVVSRRELPGHGRNGHAKDPRPNLLGSHRKRDVLHLSVVLQQQGLSLEQLLALIKPDFHALSLVSPAPHLGFDLLTLTDVPGLGCAHFYELDIDGHPCAPYAERVHRHTQFCAQLRRVAT